MEYAFKLVSSLEKVFFDKPDSMTSYTHGSMMKNEIHSFQLVGWFDDPDERVQSCHLQVESPLASYMSVYRIGYVPGILPAIEINNDNDYLTKIPGLFPDPLHKINNGELELVARQARAFWICVEPKDEKPGIYPIVMKITDKAGDQVAELKYTLEIINAELPKLNIKNTGWFHGDCIAVLHNAEIMSEAYFDLLDKYLEVYAKFGHNMILTPVFTPPIDTDAGVERPTNQLVDVVVQEGVYTFGFDNLKRWIALCQSHGIEWFEISHLFTQWGAKNTPKIMATVDGEYRKIFGWETDALSAEYTAFLNAFLPALVAFLTEERVLEKCYFHISDEPFPEHEEQYSAVREILVKYINEMQLIDALGHYSIYEKGLVKTPIVCNDHIHTFMENGVTNLWTYYCMAQRKEVANRLMAMPGYRNRILGWQIYKNRILGFLHWGFNFWFLERSRGVLNPYMDTCAGGGFPAGDPFVVYPLDSDGEVVCSTRLYVFNESMQDMRALDLLESLTDRKTVESLLNDIEGFKKYPRSNDYIIHLRECVNNLIREHI